MTQRDRDRQRQRQRQRQTGRQAGTETKQRQTDKQADRQRQRHSFDCTDTDNKPVSEYERGWWYSLLMNEEHWDDTFRPLNISEALESAASLVVGAGQEIPAGPRFPQWPASGDAEGGRRC